MLTPAMRIVHVVTSPASAWALLRGQLAWLRERGHEVSVVASPGPALEAAAVREGVCATPIEMAREMQPMADLRALFRLVFFFARHRPDVANVGTPKAGLLGGLAAAATGVPVRVYVLRGLRLETERGWRRGILTVTERLAAACSHRVVCVSHSLREEAIARRLAPAHKIVVLANGSSNGVDARRFAPSDVARARARRLRQTHGIPLEARVVGYVGRLVHDKGISELVRAVQELQRSRQDVWLLVIGEFEEGDPVSQETRRALELSPRILRLGYVDDPADWYHAMDVVALPSHREGFPNVPLEAGAAARPVVASDATGARDAVVDGETGLIFPTGDVRALERCLARVLDDPDLRRRLGQAAEERVRREFASERIWQELERLYLELRRGAHGRRN